MDVCRITTRGEVESGAGWEAEDLFWEDEGLEVEGREVDAVLDADDGRGAEAGRC